MYSVVWVLTFILVLNVPWISGSCEYPCPDNFPNECKSTCGCINILADNALINSIQPGYFESQDVGPFSKPSVTWGNCTHAKPANCAGDKTRSIPYTMEGNKTILGKLEQGFTGASTGFKCNPTTNQWETVGYPGTMYFWLCRQ